MKKGDVLCQSGLENLSEKFRESKNSPPFLLFCSLIASVAVMLACLGASDAFAQDGKKKAPPPPFKLALPGEDSDMAAINGRLGKLQKAGADCGKCAKGGGDVGCSGALKAFDEADALTKHLSELYNENKASMDDLLRHISEYQGVMDKFTERDQAVRKAYNTSKVLSDSAKLTLDILSLKDTASGLKDAMGKLKAGWTMTETEAVINKFVLSDAAFEAVSGGASAIDDLLGARLMGSDPKNQLPEKLTNIQTLKGGFSDLSGAILSAREAYRRAAAFGDPAKKMAALDGSSRGILNAVAKVGIYFAEKEQAKLQSEIEDNVAPGLAHDQLFRDLMNQYNRLVRRMAAIAKARDAAHDALSAAISCSGKCPGARQPSTIGSVSDYGKGDLRDFGDGLKSPYTYGEAMKKTNAALAGVNKAPANLDNMCKEKEKPKEQAKGQPDCPPPQKGGGLVGGVNFVTDQMKGCK